MSASEKERENMSLYSVLLVDDEEEVFQVIMKKLDWEGMGFRIAGYARNGVEALEMAEELSVDVVMTDIKMPYMDGLTLCRKLKEQYQKIKVIIFSGFDEFEYAREAIKIEAEEYILKPINANELREVFERIKNNLDKELDEKRNIDKLREYYLESLPMLQENFLTSLIDGRIPEDSIEEYAKNCSLTLKGPYFVVTVLHISTTEGALPIDPFLLAVSVKKLAEEQLAASEYDSKIVTYLGDGIVITQLPTEEAITRFTDCMDKICKMAKRVCKAKITAGIGHVCSGPEELQMSYLGAKNEECRVLPCALRQYQSHQYCGDRPAGECRSAVGGALYPEDHKKGQGGRGTAASGCDCGIYGEACGQQDVTAAVPDSHYGADHGAVAFRGEQPDQPGGCVRRQRGCVYTRHAAGVDGCTPGMAV